MTEDRLRMLERRLADQLQRDRKHPWRCRPGPDDDTIIVKPSGSACGLAAAIALETGEGDDDILNRVGNEP